MLPRHPSPAADVLIELPGRRVVLIRRKYPPPGWAIPGGFIENGESAEAAAIREAREETGLEVHLTELFNVYSDPARDPRHHTLGVIFIGHARGEPAAGDDAEEARAFSEETLPAELAFDHSRVLADYFRYRRTGERPNPSPVRPPRISPAERVTLCKIARDTICGELLGTSVACAGQPLGVLAEPGSAFVSLHVEGKLRGCIGNLGRERPLYRVVRDMALAAAFDDPRFPPLSRAELANLEIEISVLTEPVPVPAENVIPGLHGISIARGGNKAVFLPQVAREEGWSREELLEQTCLKAGLNARAWRDPATEISIFTAEVFGDKLG